MRRHRFTTTVRTISKIFYHHIVGDELRMNNALFIGFNELGGVYVKFLQLLTMRSDFFTKIEQDKKLAVYDDVESDPLDVIGLLHKELGDNVRFFKDIETSPFAAGSFGQVYHATFHDDRKVVIKILRPSILNHLSFDLKLLKFFSLIIKFVTPSAMYDIDEVFRDFREVVQSETDYIREAEYARDLYERYKNHPTLYIPYTYPELSSRGVITQDYVGGMTATKLLELKNDGVDLEVYVQKELNTDLEFVIRALGYELLYSVATADRVQGDPHLGNIKVLPNNRIGMIDFGITAPPPENRLAFVEVVRDFVKLYRGEEDIGKFFLDGLRFYVNDLYRAIQTINNLYKNSEREFNLEDEVEKAATKAYRATEQRVDVRQMLVRGQIARLFEHTINEGNRFGIKVSFDGGVMMRAASTYMSVVESFGYRQEIIPSLFEEILEDLEKNNVVLTDNSEMMEIETAVEIISEWIEDITERDPFLFRDLIIKMRRRLSVQ